MSSFKLCRYCGLPMSDEPSHLYANVRFCGAKAVADGTYPKDWTSPSLIVPGV